MPSTLPVLPLLRSGLWLPAKAVEGCKVAPCSFILVAFVVGDGEITVVRVRVVDVATGVHTAYVVRVRNVTIRGAQPDVASKQPNPVSDVSSPTRAILPRVALFCVPFLPSTWFLLCLCAKPYVRGRLRTAWCCTVLWRGFGGIVCL